MRNQPTDSHTWTGDWRDGWIDNGPWRAELPHHPHLVTVSPRIRSLLVRKCTFVLLLLPHRPAFGPRPSTDRLSVGRCVCVASERELWSRPKGSNFSTQPQSDQKGNVNRASASPPPSPGPKGDATPTLPSAPWLHFVCG